jgi:hypothetical protein
VNNSGTTKYFIATDLAGFLVKANLEVNADNFLPSRKLMRYAMGGLSVLVGAGPRKVRNGSSSTDWRVCCDVSFFQLLTCSQCLFRRHDACLT